MIRNGLTIVLLLLACTMQAKQDTVVVRINGKEICRSEFENSYNKHKASLGVKQKTPGRYMDDFVDFKLKVAAAEAVGLDTMLAFRRELEEYRHQLVKSYLTDEETAGLEAHRLYDEMKTRHRLGQVCVAHIFKYLPQNISSYTLREAEVQMDSIYSFLQKNDTNVAFDTCVKNFSDEKEPFWVSQLQMPVEFEDIVFQLPLGEISRPFFTPQGIHIVKVLERKEIPPFEEMKNEIIRRQARCHGMDKGTATLIEKLKKEYNYTPNKVGVDELMAQGYTNRILFTLDGVAYTGKDFSHFAASHPEGTRRQLDGFIMKSILDYENSRLEQKHRGLHYLIQEYRDDLLVEKITSKEVEERVLSDKSGMKSYFERHRSDYYWKEQRYKGIVLHCTTKRVSKQVRKLLKSLPAEEWKDAIRLTVNAGTHPQVQAEQGVFAPGDNAYVDDLVFKKEDAIPILLFPFTAVLGEKIKGPEDYREVLETLKVDYRSYLEGQWIEKLRAAGKVEINQEVLKTVNNH